MHRTKHTDSCCLWIPKWVKFGGRRGRKEKKGRNFLRSVESVVIWVVHREGVLVNGCVCMGGQVEGW